MRVKMYQLNPITCDLIGNTKKIINALEKGVKEGVEIAVFPELAICGYPPEDFLYHGAFIDQLNESLQRIACASQGMMAIVGTVRRGGGEKGICNSAAVIIDGKVVGYADKILLPSYDVFDERRYFDPGERVATWEYKGEKVGVLICEDIWHHANAVDFTSYGRDPVMEMKPLSPDILAVLSASPYHFEKPHARLEVLKCAAKTLRCQSFLVNQVGGNDQLVFDGHSLCVNQKGELLAQGKGFEEDEIEPQSEHPTVLKSEGIADLYRALVLGVADYFRKLGFTKACIGLSGGIDSALVAAIAVDALGKENVLGVAMPSRYNSPASFKDAADLAKNLGIELEEISIESVFTEYLTLLKPHFKEKPSDVTEENLQSRIRGMILMALSNKHGYLVLSTGNKSEIAVGYATLYGDTCGGLSVISDVLKTEVYTLCRFLNRHREVIPQNILDKPPSAELRPGQLDSDSLPSYDVIDQVIEGYMMDHLSPEELHKKTAIPLPTVRTLIAMIHRAEYKRRQSAPGIRVSRRSLLAGHRYPIVHKYNVT